MDYQSEDDVRTEEAREKKWKRYSDKQHCRLIQKCILKLRGKSVKAKFVKFKYANTERGCIAIPCRAQRLSVMKAKISPRVFDTLLGKAKGKNVRRTYRKL